MSILVIDDEDEVRARIRQVLKTQGYPEVEEASTALQAVTLLSRPVFRNRIDLILLDLRMPGTDGLKMLRRLKADAALRHIPVLMLFDAADRSAAEAALALGAVDYLAKPVPPAKLLETVEAVLGDRKGSAASRPEGLGVLLVEDSSETLGQLEEALEGAGYSYRIVARSVEEAAAALERTSKPKSARPIGLILLDLLLERDPLAFLRRVRTEPLWQDIPVLALLVETDAAVQEAYAAGATDFVAQPIRKIELVARATNALRTKWEMDRLRSRQKELLEARRKLEELNLKLRRLSHQDGLTGALSRRAFDERLTAEWRRAARDGQPLSLLLGDLDWFKTFNEKQGPEAGNQALCRVAAVFQQALTRPADLLARYGGEEFAAILPGCDLLGAVKVAERIRSGVRKTAISHPGSPFKVLTVSLGVVSGAPTKGAAPSTLVEKALLALSQAKEGGRDRLIQL